MLKHITLPDDTPRRLPFYLAMEEYVARHLPPDDYFFTWVVKPTVIFGRNQRADTEVDLDYCRANGIEVYRRRSGGGCVYADDNNIMMSYITPSTDITPTFARYTAMVAEMLCSLGLDATVSGRNDVLIEGRKVSGSAFYRLPDRSIAHGTMLYSTDIRHMLRAITPSRSKLESKQVQSVASRITTIHEHLLVSFDKFRRHIIDHLTDTELQLTPEQVKAVEEIEQQYYRPEWLWGNRDCRCGRRVRIEGVGEFTPLIARSPDGVILDANLEGDFFVTGDLEGVLLNKLRGVRGDRPHIEAALAGIHVSDIISDMTNEAFVDLVVGALAPDTDSTPPTAN